MDKGTLRLIGGAALAVCVMAPCFALAQSEAVRKGSANDELTEGLKTGAQTLTLSAAGELEIEDGTTVTGAEFLIAALGLANVATTGDYIDLINKPTLLTFGITATDVELNVLDGVTISTTELNRLAGISGNVQTLLNAKQATITGGASSIVSSNLTTGRALVSDGSGKVSISTTTATQIGYLNTLSSNVQTQLNAKAALTDPLFVDRVRVRRSGDSPGWDAGMQVTTDWHNSSVNALYIHSPGSSRRIIFGVDTQPVAIVDFSFVGSVSGFPAFQTQDNVFIGGNNNTGIARGYDGWAGLQLSGNRSMGDPLGGGIAFHAAPVFDAPSKANQRMYLRSDGSGLDVYGTITWYNNFESILVGHDGDAAYVDSVAGSGGGTVEPLRLSTDSVARIELGPSGEVYIYNLPDADPSEANRLWKDGTTLKISNGP